MLPKGENMKYTYKTQHVCSSSISFDINDDVVTNVSFTGGCNGNLKAIAKLVDGKTADEIASILKEKPERIVIGGKKQIKKPMEILLKEFSDSEVILVSDLDVNYSSAIGAIKIYENKGEASL